MATLLHFAESTFLLVGALVCLATVCQLLVYAAQMLVERWTKYSVLGRSWRDYVKNRDEFITWRKQQHASRS